MEKLSFCPTHADPLDTRNPWPCAASEAPHCPHYEQELSRHIYEVTELGNYFQPIPEEGVPVVRWKVQEFRNHEPYGAPRSP